MPDTRKNKHKIQKGGQPPENTIKTSRLLIVKNALEAIAFAGANLFAAPEWVVVCDSGESDGGHVLFYKSMSMTGVYDYHYGFGENFELLRKLARSDWCLIATTDSNGELTQVIREIFNQEPTIITVQDKELPAKLNKFKTVILRKNESVFQRDEAQTVVQKGGVIDSSIVQSIQGDLRAGVEKPDVYAEFLTHESFTVHNILKKMNEIVEVVQGENKYTTFSHILYLPETSSENAINALKKSLPLTMNMDMLFVDNRPTTAIAEQYFYSIDLSQPIIIRTNDKTRKFIALLQEIENLRDIFKQGYQFLSTMRICPIPVNLVSSKLKEEQPAQGGGDGQIVDEYDEYDEFGFEEDINNQLAVNPLQSFFGMTEQSFQEEQVQQAQPVVTVGGNRNAKSRKTIKHARRSRK